MKTLGNILYADTSKVRISEEDWLQLLRGVAAGDYRALHSLYQRTHRIVFTLIVRIIADRETAEEVTLDVFHDVWRKASTYGPADGSVIGWIMNQARGRIDYSEKRVNLYPDNYRLTTNVVDPQHGYHFEERSRWLRNALAVLTREEHNTIETAFFSELTYDEAATKLNQPVETVKTRIRSGLHSLREALDRNEGRAKGKPGAHSGEHLDPVFLFALQALPRHEIAAAEAQIASCGDCRHEFETLRAVVRSFVGWSTDVLRPAESLWNRLAQRIAAETATRPFVPRLEERFKPEWEEAARGIQVKILARNAGTDTVSMLVRLDPGINYPAHIHAGAEELHLLHGILKVNDRTLYAGDFLRSEAGSVDHVVWSISGCTCFLTTSTKDTLF